MNLLLLEKYKNENTEIIELENRNKVPVGSIDLAKLNIEDIVLLETKDCSEKYLISVHGISVFFSFWRKLNG